jgi:mono/diheme cytochrome c family protein
MKRNLASLHLMVVLAGASLVSSSNGQQNNKTNDEQGAKRSSVYDELTKAPDKARTKRNPMEKDPEAVAAGRNLFEQHCAECHGDAAQGGKKGPSLRATEVQNAEAGVIFWVLTNGVVRKGMPVWSKLPEPQRWQLVSFIKSLGVGPAKEEPTMPAKPQTTDLPSRRR